MDNVGIYIGTAPETVRASGELILAILDSRAEDKTKRAALSAMVSVCGAPTNNSLSNCQIDMHQPPMKTGGYDAEEYPEGDEEFDYDDE